MRGAASVVMPLTALLVLAFPTAGRPLPVRAQPAARHPVVRGWLGSRATKKAKGCAVGAWCMTPSGTYPFEVWLTRTKQKSRDQQLARRAVAVMNGLWGPMVADMGAPLPDIPRSHNGHKDDAGNADDNVDIYILRDTGKKDKEGAAVLQDVVRDGGPRTLEGAAQAKAVSTGASVTNGPNSSSGFLLLRLSSLQSRSFKSDAAHEFFHVLQDAYNYRTGRFCRPGYWFTEASATWAESHYVPDTALDEVYGRFDDFQKTSASEGLLPYEPLSVEDPHQYTSFIYPYFMEQAGGVGLIVKAWKSMTDATSCDALNGAIDGAFPFAGHMREFALRNLNDPKFDSAGAPITPNYNALHHDFPTGGLFTPPLSNQSGNEDTLHALGSTDASIHQTGGLNPLQSLYFAFEIDNTVTELVRQIKFDFSSISHVEALSVDAVVHDAVTGKWQVEALSGKMPKPLLCFDDAEVDEFYLVVSNHDYHQSVKTQGQWDMRPVAASCNCSADPSLVEQFSAQSSADYQFSSGPIVTLQRHASNLTATLKPTDAGIEYGGQVTSGFLSMHGVYQGDDGTETQEGSAQLQSSGDNTGSLDVTFDLPNCTYQVSASAQVNVVDTTPQGSSDDDVGLSYASGWLPIPSNFAISGSATVPAYNLVPSDRLLATGTDARWFQLEPSDGFITSWLQAVSTDVYGQVGTASISWQLTPAMRPGARRQ